MFPPSKGGLRGARAAAVPNQGELGKAPPTDSNSASKTGPASLNRTSRAQSSLLPPTTPPQNPNTSPPVSPEVKLRAAQEKAKISGVHTLTQEDIDGLSYEQIKQLRGY